MPVLTAGNVPARRSAVQATVCTAVPTLRALTTGNVPVQRGAVQVTVGTAVPLLRAVTTGNVPVQRYAVQVTVGTAVPLLRAVPTRNVPVQRVAVQVSVRPLVRALATPTAAVVNAVVNINLALIVLRRGLQAVGSLGSSSAFQRSLPSLALLWLASSVLVARCTAVTNILVQ